MTPRVFLKYYSTSHLRHTYRTYYKLLNLELFLTQLYDLSFNVNHVDLIYIYIATMIRPHSTTFPRKTVQEIVLVIENMN